MESRKIISVKDSQIHGSFLIFPDLSWDSQGLKISVLLWVSYCLCVVFIAYLPEDIYAIFQYNAIDPATYDAMHAKNVPTYKQESIDLIRLF